MKYLVNKTNWKDLFNPALGGMLFITVFVVLFSTASSVLGSADQMLSRL